MVRTKGRRRLTCHHEAGHALMRWYFGHKTDRALVLTVDEVRAGKTVKNRKGVDITSYESIVEGYDIHGYPYGPMLTAGSTEEQNYSNYLRAINRDVELINCFAGTIAEAHYRHASVSGCMLAGGIQDMQHARFLVDTWDLPHEEQPELLRLSE